MSVAGGDGICGGWTGVEAGDGVAQPCISAVSSSKLAFTVCLALHRIGGNPLNLLTKGVLARSGLFLGLQRGLGGFHLEVGQLMAVVIGLHVTHPAEHGQQHDGQDIDPAWEEVEQLEEDCHTSPLYFGMRLIKTSRTWWRLMSHADLDP